MIRLAAFEDIPRVVDLLVDLHSEDIGYSDFPQDREYVTGNLVAMLDKENIRLFLDSELRGFLLASASREWFTPQIKVSEETLYIHPAHRGGSLAWRLVRELEKWAHSLGAWKIVVGVSTSSQTAVHLYERLGYNKLGCTLIKHL